MNWASVLRRLRLAGSVTAIALSCAGSAYAQTGENDETVQSLLERAFKEDVKTGPGRKKAKAKLDFSRNLCGGNKCSKPVMAKVEVSYGTIAALDGNKTEAQERFIKALELDPKVALVAGHDGPSVKEAFEAAKNPQTVQPVPVPTPGPEPAAGKPDTRKKLDECDKGSGNFPRGWPNYTSFCYFSEAVASEAAQEWVNCADYASRSVEAYDNATTRYLGAQCGERGGRWVEALQGYLDVAAKATADGKKATATEARARAKFLRERIPKMVIQTPPNATEVRAWIDGAPVSADQVGGEIWVNPGKHLVEVKGKLPQGPLNWKQTVTTVEGQKKIVEVAKGEIDPVVQKCIESATTPAEIAACLEDKSASPFTFTVTGEFSGYLDTDAVEVMTPEIALQAENSIDGWGIGASFLVDVVTAASADIVATASPRWTEVRYVPAINAHVKPGDDVDLSIDGTISVEPDYIAVGAGAGIAVDFNQKNVTPALRYDFGYDISGRAGTPFAVYSEKIHRHGATASLTLVLDKSSILIPAATAVLEFGDTSKPYRYLPTFDPGVETVKGENIDSVNARRTPVRISDQLPDSRQRYAVAMLYARRFESVTLRLSERGYIDSWGVFATTTDFTLPIDITDNVMIFPHLRFHFQTAAKFWERSYTVDRDSDGRIVIPLLRTGDPELGPLLTGYAGGGARIDLTGDDRMGLTLKVDFMYTRFLDHLFKNGRFAGFGAATYDVVFD